MSFSHKFLVPDYYENFHCKGGDCRSTCCDGWGISVTREEYFRLLGMDCPPDLRKRLDCAFHSPRDPSPERYMLLTPRWDGDCPLRAEDGLCALQCACGEEVLPSICRYYPRGVRTEFACECSCTNSCEKVLEMLFEREEPLTFVTRPLHFAYDPPRARALRKPRGYYNAIRKMCGDILHYRKESIGARVWRVHRALKEIAPLMDGDAGEMMATLTRLSLCAEPLPMVKQPIEPSLQTVRDMAEVLAENSVSLSDYNAAARGALPDAAAYEKAGAHFEALFPHWERDMENMLLNHIFYECFPFSDAQESLADEGAALCATYALVRYLTVGYLADKKSRDDYVDAAAAAFRLIEHSRFDHNAAVILHRLDSASDSALNGLLQL